VALVAWLQQLLAHGGYFDEQLDFVRVERVQLVASMSSATGAGRHMLSPRFLSRLGVVLLEPPAAAQLQVVYGTMLQQTLAG
jgi:dynein heavy chain 2